MKIFYITFRSVTYAQRGEKLLAKHNIRCHLLRTPRWMEEQGCGYALRIWSQDGGSAAALLRENQIPMRRLYVQNVGGQLEEIPI